MMLSGKILSFIFEVVTVTHYNVIFETVIT